MVVVLGLLTTLFVMALSLGAAVRSDLAQSRRFQDDTAAELLAEAGVDWAVHVLNELTQHEAVWRAPWRHQPAQFQQRRLGVGTFDIAYVNGNGSRVYGLQDEEARINLNRAPRTVLAALPGSTASIAEAIEAQRQQRAFTTPEELLGRGIVSPEVFYGTADRPGMAPYVTVWGSGKINVNTAPPPVLAAVPSLTPAMAEAVVRYRHGNDRQPDTADDRLLRVLDDLLAVPGIDRQTLTRVQPLLTVMPTAFRVIVTGRVQSAQGADRVHQRLAIIDRAVRPVRIVYWRRLE